MRIIGLDYGSVTVGVAISDPLGITAQGLETIHRKQENKLRRTLARLEEIIKEYDVSKIILGYPKHLNNTVGKRAKLTEEFADKLMNRTGIEVVLWDERLTTVEVGRILDKGGLGYKKKAAVEDKLAAVLILQGYLDKKNYEEANN